MNEEFEPYDVTAEAPEPEAVSAEALADLAAGTDELREVSQARDEAESRFMAPAGAVALAAAEDGPAGLGNVVGVGIAEKLIGGIPTGQLGVTVFVKEKLARRRVSSESLVPESIGGAPTDVEAIGEVYAQMFTGKYRPAPGGVSIGNCTQNMAGTLGCLVTRSNQLFVLSNNHVMALVNTSPLVAGIPQPGLLDGGACPGEVIAHLTQFVPIAFGPGVINIVDAAIAQASPNLVDRRILRPNNIRQQLVAPAVQPALNAQVQKSGRTTQYRRGLVDALNVTLDVSYAPVGGVARFSRQFRVKGTTGIFSDRGDSGSLVTSFPGNQPMGLLFSGNATTNVTFCNPIGPVASSFGATIGF